MCRRFNLLAAAIKQKMEGASPSMFVAIIGHQPNSILVLLEDDSIHSSIEEPDSNATEAIERACFVATRNKNDEGVRTPPN